MSDEYTDNKIEAKQQILLLEAMLLHAETIPAKEAPDQELYHAKSFWTKWVFPRCKSYWCSICFNCNCNWFYRINFILGNEITIRFSRNFFFSRSSNILSISNDAWNDYGYLSSYSIIFGGFGNYLIPLW